MVSSRCLHRSLTTRLPICVGAERGAEMDWWDVVVQLGVLGFGVGATGAGAALLRVLPWGKGWSVGGYP